MVRPLLWCLLLGAACTDTSDATMPVSLRFTPDPGPVGSERYLCFGFPADELGAGDIGGITFLPAEGPVLLHHITLFASPAAYAAGPVDCLAMPEDAIAMNVWATGGGDVALAADVSLVVPPAATFLIVQAHALRTDEGPARASEIELAPRPPAAHRAGWLPVRAPVPVIQPNERGEVTASCAVDAPLHLVSTWPHMHQIGAEFHGSVVRGGGSVEPLVDVEPWQFDAQRAYAVDVDLAAGDAIDTRCVWINTTGQPVLPGPRITDEMCGQSLIAYPFEAARCR